MKISARNQLTGKVESIKEGAVNSMVTLNIGSEKVVGTISLESVKELGLAIGKEATAIVKATEVMIGKGELKISARNKFTGKVVSISEGKVNSIVTVEVCGGNKISSTISNEAVKELELAIGMEVVTIIKATSVMIAA